MEELDCDQAVNLLEQCITVYSGEEGEEEGNLYSAINNVLKWKSCLLAKRENNIKESLQKVEKECEEALSQVEETNDTDTENQIQHINQQLKTTKEHHNQVQSQIIEKKQKLTQLTDEQSELERKQLMINETNTKDLPNSRIEMNLYSNISCIRWQFEAEPPEIKGYVTNKNSVRPFSLNTRKNSKFFITNYLWGQMEPDW